MKLDGVIYFYCPKESDFKDRDILREHLVRPTTGRVFIQINEEHQWTIPFGSTTQLISILIDIRRNDPSNLDFTPEKQNFAETKKGRILEDRRCLRISIVDVDAATDPLCHAHYLGQEGLDAQKIQNFTCKSTGQFILLDSDKDYKYRYTYFTDMFDAGIQLDKIFSREVAKRIPVSETVNIPYDVED